MKRSLLLALACLALLLALFSTPLALPARADTALSQADLDALALKGEALPPALGAKIAPDLLRSLYAEPAADAPEHPKDATATFLVVLRDQADLEPAARIAARAERRWAVYDALRQTAERSQRDMVAALAALQDEGHVRAFQSFFIFNGLAVTGDLHALLSLAARPEVANIYPNRTHTLPPRPDYDASSAAEPDAAHPGAAAPVIPWNIAKIRADLVWGGFNVTGQGIVVANMDTGVDYQHPALLHSYRGYDSGAVSHSYNWYDATGGYPTVPQDGNGHGTHTMGTIVGSEPDGSKVIGVAPGAEWIAVKIFTDAGEATDATILEGFQWILAPTDLLGANPDPAKAPDIVSNSWGSDESADLTFREALRAWRAAGIFSVFASGNEGPGAGTVNAPASLPEAVAIGAVDIDSEIAMFSSRGPSPWGEVKPDIVAPGVDIYSSVPGGGYERGWNGTSMATPHVAGLAALLWDADRRYNVTRLLGAKDNPTLTITETKQILMQTAVELGPAGPDNAYGWGLVDAYQAVRTVIPHGSLRGRVTDATTGLPVPGALIVMASREHGGAAKTLSNAQGEYRLDVAAGFYDVTASSFAYQPGLVPGIQIMRDANLQLDLALTAQPAGTVQGTVRSAATLLGLPAKVQVLDTPVVAQANAAGQYTLRLPAGTYTLRAFADVPGYRGIQPAPLTVTAGATVTLNLALPAGPTILLVNADVWRQEKKGDYYERSLSANLYDYDVWDIAAFPEGNPSAADLAPYDVVIWSHPKNSPGYIGAWPALAAYLDGGGALLMTGQDIGYWDVEREYAAATYRSRLHASYVRDDVNLTQVTGLPAGVLAGLHLTLGVPDSAQNQTYPSEIAPADSLALPIARYVGDGYAGVQIDDCSSRVVYLAFGLEGLGELERQVALARALDWLSQPRQPHDVALAASNRAQSGVMGQSIAFHLSLVNTGQQADAFTLSVTGSAWPVHLLDLDGNPLSTLSLGPCSSAEVVVQVDIPATTGIGEKALLTIVAQSTTQAHVQAEVTLEATAFPTWQTATPLPTPRSRLAAVGIGRQVYVIGGETATSYANNVDIYDPASGAWQSGSAKPTRAAHLSIAAIGAKIYAPGGYNGVGLRALEVYNATANAWSVAASLPEPRYGHATVALDGQIYVMGGLDGERYTQTTWRYNPATDSWTALAAMPQAGAYAAAAALDGKIYVLGGRNATQEDLPYVQIYDPAADAWTLGREMETPRMGAAAVAWDGRIYVVGGGYTAFLDLAERYDPAADRWEALIPLQQGRRTLGLALACGSLYAIGGWDGQYAATNESLTIGSSLIGSTLNAGAPLAQPGDTLTYRILLTNGGNQSLPQSSVRQPLPAGTSYVPGSATGGATYQEGLDEVRWAGDIAARQTISLTFQARLDASLVPGQTITATAYIDDGQCGPYAKTAATRIAVPDLSASRKALVPAQVASGDTVTCVLTLTNTSLVAAARAALADPVPAGLAYLPGTATGGATFDPERNRLEWRGSVPAGQMTQASYQWVDSDSGDAAFGWVDATGGALLPGGDDDSLGPFPIGFDFEFFRQPYTQFYVNTNGQVLFGEGSNSYTNTYIPRDRAPNNFIAAFWDDLRVGAANLYYQTYGVAPHRYTVIEWHQVERYRTNDRYTFEIILYEGSNAIAIQYQSLTGEYAAGVGASVGLENASGADGLGYLYDGEPTDHQLHDQLALRFWPPPALTPGEQVLTWRYRVQDDLPANTALANTAVITDAQGLVTTLTATAQANLVDLSPSTKEASKAWAAAGDLLDYTITLRNAGAGATEALWTDTLPAELSLITGTLQGPGSPVYDPVGRVLSWSGTVPAGAPATFAFRARLSAESANDQVITNTVQIQTRETGQRWDRAAQTIVKTADLSPSYKQVSHATPGNYLTSGSLLTYTIGLVNAAPIAALGVALRDPIPANAAYVPGSVTGGARYDAAENAVLWEGDVSAASTASTRYVYRDSRTSAQVAYQWVETGEFGVDLELGDDDYAYVDLPFPFAFYDATHTRMAIGSNGTLSFDDRYLGRSNTCLPSGNSYDVSALIAAFWDDLNPAQAGRVRYAVLAAAPQRQVVVQWDGVQVVGGGPVTFEAILYEGSNDILVQYKDVAAGLAAEESGATVGLQADAARGLAYSCGAPALADGLAVRFTRQPTPSEHRISFQVAVAEGLPTNAAIANRAVIAQGAAISHTLSVTTTVNVMDLRLSTKTVTPSVAGAGELLTYTITLRNDGIHGSPQVSLVDPLPDWLELITSTISGGAVYDAGLHRLTWQGPLSGTLPYLPGGWQDSDASAVPFAWVDAIGGTEVRGGDDVARGPFPIGFPFGFFGNTYTEFHINSNGQVLFGEGSNRYSNAAIPTAATPNNFIAAFWDDLVCPELGGLYYQTFGDAPHRYTVIQWQNARALGSTSSLTFQVILHEGTSDIVLQYRALSGTKSDGASATVGLENAAGNEGVLYLHDGLPAANLLHNDLAIRFRQPRSAQPSQRVLTFHARVREDAPANHAITNTAVIDNGLGQSLERSATALVNTVDLSPSDKTVDRSLAASGDVLRYTITVRNVGTGVAAGVVVTDPLPASAAYVADSATNGAIYEPERHRITWTGDVGRGASAPFSFAIRTASAIADQTILTNTAQIAFQGLAPLARSAQTLLRSPDITASDKQVSAERAAPGEVVTYTLSIRNTSAVAAAVWLTDALPATLQYVPGSLWASSGQARIEASTVLWQGEVLGQSVVLVRFAAQVGEQALGTVVNTALLRLGDREPLSRSASLTVQRPGRRLYFPLVFK